MCTRCVYCFLGVYEGGLLLPPWVCMRGGGVIIASMGVYEGGGYYCLHGCVYEVGLLMPGCVRGWGGGGGGGRGGY